MLKQKIRADASYVHPIGFVCFRSLYTRAVKRLVEMEAVPYSGKEDGDTILHKCVSKSAKGAPERVQVSRLGTTAMVCGCLPWPNDTRSIS
jgi:hypothetical protein